MLKELFFIPYCLFYVINSKLYIANNKLNNSSRDMFMSSLKYSYTNNNQFKVRYVYVRHHHTLMKTIIKTVNNASQTNNGTMQFDKN